MAKIAFIEDDPALAQELAVLLTRAGHEPFYINDFSHTVDAALDCAPDLILLDLNLPGTDGTLICRELRCNSSVPIMVVTSRTGEVDEVLSMTLGADDFVTKPYRAQVLLARIDALLRRSSGSFSAILEHKGVKVDINRSTATACGRTVELTKNELRILTILLRHAGTIVPRETIMAELWDSDAFVDDNTLTVNINRLRQTLASIGVKDYLHTHRGQGYSI